MPAARMTIPISSPPRLLLANCSSSISHPTRYLQLRRVAENGRRRSDSPVRPGRAGVGLESPTYVSLPRDRVTASVRRHVRRRVADGEGALHAVVTIAAQGVRAV